MKSKHAQWLLTGVLVAWCATMHAQGATIRIIGGAWRTFSHVSATGLLVDASADVGGTGTVQAATIVWGSLTPGNGTNTGTLAFTGTVAFEGGRLNIYAEDSTRLSRIEAAGAVSGVATAWMTRAATAFPTQQVVVAGAAGSDYSLFVVMATNDWISGESGALNLWVTYAQAPVVGPVTLWRATNQTLKASDLMLLTNAVDPQGSALAVVWVSPDSTNNGTVVLSGRWTTYTPPVGNDAPDFFAFRVQNEYGKWADGEAEVIVITPASEGQTMNISSVAPSASNTVVRFIGIPGRSYDVQSTTNLVSTPWMKIGEITIGAQGHALFTDTNAPASQYYRTARP